MFIGGFVNLDGSRLGDRFKAAGNIDDARAALKDVPAVKINFDPEITIEFNPAK